MTERKKATYPPPKAVEKRYNHMRRAFYRLGEAMQQEDWYGYGKMIVGTSAGDFLIEAPREPVR